MGNCQRVLSDRRGHPRSCQVTTSRGGGGQTYAGILIQELRIRIMINLATVSLVRGRQPVVAAHVRRVQRPPVLPRPRGPRQQVRGGGSGGLKLKKSVRQNRCIFFTHNLRILAKLPWISHIISQFSFGFMRL